MIGPKDYHWEGMVQWHDYLVNMRYALEESHEKEVNESKKLPFHYTLLY